MGAEDEADRARPGGGGQDAKGGAGDRAGVERGAGAEEFGELKPVLRRVVGVGWCREVLSK